MKDYDLFLQYAQLGEDLSKCHLLEEFADHPIKHHPQNSTKVESVFYESSSQKLHYNKESYFEAIPESLWDLHIGGYQVLKSWLESRKSRELSLEESQKFEDIVCALLKAERIIEEITSLDLG